MADAPQMMSPEQQSSSTPSVSQPTSGTYGEGVDLANLKKSLPVGNLGNPAPVSAPPTPTQTGPQQGGPQALGPAGLLPSPGGPARPAPNAPQGRPGTGVQVPPGIPGALLQPTQQPQTPVSTPLNTPTQPFSGVQNAQQGRLALLYTLASNPNNSPDTREWATHVLNALIARGGGQ